MVHDTTDRGRHETELTVEFLHLVNESRGTQDLIQAVTEFFWKRSGCDAVGIRLRDGNDYPYFGSRGFSEEFVLLENHLCGFDAEHRVRFDDAGNAVLECMCGTVIRKRFDPSKPFFTAQGTFWTNSTSELLAGGTEQLSQAPMRNRCNSHGYESMALIPLRSGDEPWGLIQLNDKRKGRFTPESIALWERLAQQASIALGKARAEEALREANDKLEARVKERTAELERAKEAMAAERRRLYDILETMPVMVCLVTPDYHVAFANRSFREKFGEDKGRRCFDYCFGREEPCEFCKTHDVLKTGERRHWEFAAPDGSTIDVYAFPFSDTDGSPLILEIEIDITEQRRAQEVVKAERQRLYDVLETLPVYVCLLDANYYMPFANRYFRETFGKSGGRRCHDFLFGRNEPCEICETYTVMKTRAPHHWYWTGPNGRDYDIYDFPFIDTDGSFLILEMGIDITERNRAEDALRQTLADLTRSNQDLEHFAYVASHDLQEPLRNVASTLQMLEKRQEGKLDGQSNQLINYAVDSAKKMKALITDLLTYSRLTTRGRPFESVDVQDVLHQSLQRVESLVADQQAEITYDPMPSVIGDSTQLSQVFQNLIANAVRFRSTESPKIHVSGRSNESEWIFSVKDNGIGIEAEYFDRIFVIFQQLSKKVPYQGTGMGLAIVKKIVERHRGRVWVESEVGVGSTFYFTIPKRLEA